MVSPWKKTTKRLVASVYTNCETALGTVEVGIDLGDVYVDIGLQWGWLAER